MKKLNFPQTVLTVCLVLLLTMFSRSNLNAQTFCTKPGKDQVAGVKDDYRYELWNQNGEGTACMTIGDGALFSGEWSDILNYLARRGLGYDETEEHAEIGTFYSTYDCDYNPSSESGNSYLSIYGWTTDPLIEFYIVEDWRNWIPSMAVDATKKGEVELNGSNYDIIQNTRVEQPSIVGTATFEQYFSIRKNTRNKGTINISDHFKAWEDLGMKMGKMYEVSFVVEGYKSSGSFEFKELEVFVTDGPLSTSDSAIADKIRIFQNSGNGNLTIDFIESLENANVAVYSAQGKRIFLDENAGIKPVQIGNLKSGIYIVNISGGKMKYKTTFLVK